MRTSELSLCNIKVSWSNNLKSIFFLSLFNIFLFEIVSLGSTVRRSWSAAGGWWLSSFCSCLLCSLFDCCFCCNYTPAPVAAEVAATLRVIESINLWDKSYFLILLSCARRDRRIALDSGNLHWDWY